MRKVLHKVKSQWIVLGVLGATVVSLGTADVRQVAASEIEGASASETIAARELGTADVSVEAAEKAAHIGLDHAIDTATTDGTATVFVHWNEDGTITVTVKDLNGSVLYSDLLVDSEGENTIKVLTANQDYYTIDIAVKAAATEQTTTATEPIELDVPEVLAEVEAPEEVAAEENDYAKIVSTTEVDYPAVIARATDAINTAPWGVEGYQTLASSADYAGKTVDVTKEQVTDYGVTWALVSLNGKELGWIAKDALTVQTYAAITSETIVDYPATISRGTDAINLAPWGTKGFQTIASSAAYVGKTVDVIKEQTTDYGVTWAQISLNGEVLGWIAKDALAVQTYAAVVSETVVDYPATVNRDSDAINTAPWGVKGYQTLSSSAAYVGQTVEVIKEQVTDYGVTWAQISLNGEVLGWIAKDALKIQTYAQITKETAVDYSATISRDSDAINTAPWGVKGYQTLSSSAAYVGQTVEVIKEQVTDYGVTWALVSQNGKELGWIAKDALKVQTYAQITKETAVSYDAIVNRDSDAINTAPWGVKGYQTLSSSAAYAGQTVEVTKEQTTDYGVTWALVSQNGKELGWIAKDALKVQTYAQITKETAVNYDAIVSRDSDAINTAPWGVKGYQTLSSSAAFVGQTVEVTKEQVTNYGVTWALVSQNGKELGWIAKDALKVQTYAQIVSENEVAYPALINRSTDAINTSPWGTKGYQTNASSADYLGQTVEVTKEQTTDYGVTWALVSLNGKDLGWIAKDALTVMERTVQNVVAKENTVAYQTVTEEDNTIPTGESQVAQAGADGYDTVTYDVTYVNGVETNRVEVSRTTTAPMNEIVKVGTQVTEVKTKTTNENEVAFTTIEEEDNTIPTGERVVVQTGVNGYDTVVFDVTYVNGVETSRVEAGRKTTAPVNEIVKVGTQVTEVKSETKVEKEIAYATVEELDNTIPTGERVVVKAGAKGYDKVTYDVTYVNGIETNRVEISRATTAPVTEIVKVGTQVTEVKSETTTENEVAFTTVEEFDNTIPTGERVVVQAGVKGYDTVTFDVTYMNGVETNRIEVSRKTTAPIAEVVKVGTQVTEVKSETITEKTVVYTSVEEFDNTIPTGERVVVQAGANGHDTVIYDVTFVNGIETNRVEVSRTTTAPVAEVIKVGTQVTEVKSESAHANTVQYGTQEQADANQFIGERQVIQQGSEGYDVILYDVTYVNGVEVSRTEVSRETIAPVEEIVKVGTKQAIAQIGGFRIEGLSIDASGVYEGYNSKNVVLGMTATSKNANITNAYVNYESANGYSDQLQFVNVGNNVFEATIPFSSYYTHAGLYQIGLIGASDSAGNTWVIFPEGNGSGLNYTSADLSAADFTIKETSGLASVAGVTLESITIENPSVYVGEWSSNKVTMKVKSDGAPISSAFIAFTLPNGWDNRCDFVYVGNDTYEATITPYPTFLVGAGSYGVESINIYDANGNVFIFFPEGYGTGLNYDSGDLSGVYFDAINRPVVTMGTIGLPNAIPFDTIHQDDPNLMVGETKVIQSGVFGNETQYYTVTYTDGIETDRVWSHSELVSAPLAEIVAVGTKQPLAQIGGFTLKDLSVEADVAYAGDWEDSKIVTMKVSGTSSTIQSAHFNYRLPSGGYGQEDFVYVGNDTYEVAVPTYFWGAGSYQTDSIFLIDSNGSSWVIMSEGNGAGMNYTSADLSASDFEVLPAIASIGGVTLISMNLEDNVIYEDDGTSNKLTIKLKDNDAPISTAYIVYTLPNGYNKRFDFISVGNDVYEAIINQPYGSFIVGAGNYQVETIFIGDANGDYSLFYPEGYGSGLNYTSGNLSEGNFEVLAKPKNILETTTESVPFDTVYQDDSSMLIGETRLIQSGVAGTKTNYYNVTYYNGVETAREWTHSEVTMVPISEILLVGTKVESVDITKPTVDSSSIKVSQKIATAGDTIVVTASITDNVGIRYVEMAYKLTDGSFVTVEMKKNNETGLYEAVFSISSSSRVGFWELGVLRVYDTSNNYTLGSTYYADADFTVVGETDADVTKPTVDSSSIKVSQKIATAGDTIVVTASITDNVGIRYVEMAYKLTDGSFVTVEMKKNNETGLYEAVFPISSSSRVGFWELGVLRVYDTSNNYTLGSTYYADADFTVVGETDADVTKPTVDSSSIKVSQKIATAGDTIVVTASITDDVGIRYVEMAYKLTDGSFVTVEMKKNNETGLYEAIFPISSSSRVGFWELGVLRVYDTSNNYTLGSTYYADADFTVVD